MLLVGISKHRSAEQMLCVGVELYLLRVEHGDKVIPGKPANRNSK